MTTPLLPARFPRREFNVTAAAEREYINEKLATFKIAPS